jgi:hypothetical protein
MPNRRLAVWIRNGAALVCYDLLTHLMNQPIPKGEGGYVQKCLKWPVGIPPQIRAIH